MTRDEFAAHLREIFDAHDDVFRALRDANPALVTAVQAHDAAIVAALAANRAALTLLSKFNGHDGDA
jgi:hypothetical protein